MRIAEGVDSLLQMSGLLARLCRKTLTSSNTATSWHSRHCSLHHRHLGTVLDLMICLTVAAVTTSCQCFHMPKIFTLKPSNMYMQMSIIWVICYACKWQVMWIVDVIVGIWVNFSGGGESEPSLPKNILSALEQKLLL